MLQFLRVSFCISVLVRVADSDDDVDSSDPSAAESNPDASDVQIVTRYQGGSTVENVMTLQDEDGPFADMLIGSTIDTASELDDVLEEQFHSDSAIDSISVPMQTVASGDTRSSAGIGGHRGCMLVKTASGAYESIRISHFIAMERTQKKLSSDRMLRIVEAAKSQLNAATLASELDKSTVLVNGMFCAVAFEDNYELGCVRKIGFLSSGNTVNEVLTPVSLINRVEGLLVWMNWLELDDTSARSAGETIYAFGPYYPDPGMTLYYALQLFLHFSYYITCVVSCILAVPIESILVIVPASRRSLSAGPRIVVSDEAAEKAKTVFELFCLDEVNAAVEDDSAVDAITEAVTAAAPPSHAVAVLPGKGQTKTVCKKTSTIDVGRALETADDGVHDTEGDMARVTVMRGLGKRATTKFNLSSF